ncbi:HNH endonuclease signature motif containing protein [Ornithinimicrobium sufpigmenti]|uniref:HNH endonuclease signature motif containing protein n=1 Tax=Ornithinimicrobium sufpigmenti TaxID=2508882 RepID=UPI0010357FBB|nr:MULTISPECIES: HNH endonuclease signature motif containing protein [unclassified Ornithinimicrobium]
MRDSGPPEGSQDRRGELVEALLAVGLDEQAAVLLGDAAMVLGALSQGRRVRDLELGSTSGSARAADQRGTRSRDDAAPGSMEEQLHQGDVALGAVEALAACSARLEAAMVVAASEQVTAVGAALLAQRDVSDPTELSRTARERWRARAKSRVRQELAPAIGWSPGECAHLVALACAPIAFGAPVVGQMARGQLPWRLARSLWRACEGLDAADAAHIATIMCADDPTTCVPERLAPDGRVQSGPWQHRAFYAALTREVTKVTQADDADPEAARVARARREAAFAGRRVLASVDEDGTGSLTLITSAFWVAAIKDRLTKAARAARGAGDQRTLDQLESDFGRTLLAHATVGFADQPDVEKDAEDDDEGAARTPEDLTRAGWSPQLVQALSGLPPAVLQVIVPLMGLHDPAAAETLPTIGRTAPRPHPHPAGRATDEPVADEPATTAPAPNAPAATAPAASEPAHTGRPGCPACLPGVRTGQHAPAGAPARHGPGVDCASGRGPAGDSDGPAIGVVRRLWVGEVLGSFSMFVSPAGVRALALAPGTTLSRLLVDPADGRCVERSITTYRPDAAMRAQILAADVTCRAPACDHTGSSCQVDHVVEYGTPGGLTKETNAQLAHTGHHEAKTAKDWDADLSANRDVEWTTLLGRIYRTRAWDYRRYVTLVVDALDAVRSAPVEDQATELDRQVYLALTHRDLGERLNVGDDDLDPDISRFEGWGFIGLTHRDGHTGRRVAGPSAEALAEVHAARATSGPPAGATADGSAPVSEASAATKASVPASEASVAATGSASACGEPCCRHLRRVASGGSAPHSRITRIDGRTGEPVTGEELRELRKAWSLANHEGIAPF